MPMQPGKSRKAISSNIHELSTSRTKAGRARNARPNAHAINVAIALREADKSKKGVRK